ncbi:Neutral amino acid transporter B(0) [Blomia tropicalis]|nr:Neutral amino acid transporter B(0) [Blomia tropicalis]
MSLKTRLLSFFRENQNSLWTICGVISGLLVGLLTKFILSQNGIDQIDPTIHRFISLPGAIYIRVCMMLIAPLLLCSLATSLINGENVDEPSHNENNRKEESNFLFTSILFFIGFTGISAAIGIGTMALVKPGSILEMQLNTSSANVVDDPTIIRRNSIQNHIFQVDSMINLVLHIFPDNLVSPLFAMQYIQTISFGHHLKICH